MASSVRDVDKGYRKLIDKVFKLQKPKVAVGIFEADGQASAGEGVTLIEVAVINEFGGGNVPARSFLRGWFDENKERAQKTLMKLLADCLEKEGDPKKAIEVFGLWLQGEIQKRIAQGIPPANAPSTIEKKGSSKPLIDKGQLRSSITFAIDWGTGRLKVHKSHATKNREAAAKAEAREERKAARRQATMRKRARRKATRQARRELRKNIKGALRNVKKGGKRFLRKAKKLVKSKKRRR
jgi:hypothetical protein